MPRTIFPFKAMMERAHAVAEIVRQDPDVATFPLRSARER